jgi:hypothetical protein
MTKPESNLTDAQILAFKTQARSLVADTPEAEMAMSIVRTLGMKLTDAEWIQLYRGVIPEIMPLNPKQLDALRGGLYQPDYIPFPFPDPTAPLLL